MTAELASSVPRKMRRAIRPDMQGVTRPLAEQIFARFAIAISASVKHYARVLRRISWVDVEDLEQHAKIAAIEAHCSFDPSRGVAEVTWAARIIRARLHDLATSILDPTEVIYTAHRKKLPPEEIAALRHRVQNVTQPARIPLTTRDEDRGAGEMQSTAFDFTEQTPSPEEQALETAHARAVIALANNVLTPHERLVFHAELAGTKGDEIARRTGVSKQAVGATRKRAFRRIREALETG